MGLEKYTSKQLAEELASRAKAGKIPEPIANPDFSALTTMVVDGVLAVVTNRPEAEDMEHWVWEAAMEAVYGKDVWTWYNKLAK